MLGDFQHHGGNVVVLAAIVGKPPGLFEKEIERFPRGSAPALPPDFAQSFPAEIGVLMISKLVQTVGRKQHGIAGRQLHRMCFVA